MAPKPFRPPFWAAAMFVAALPYLIWATPAAAPEQQVKPVDFDNDVLPIFKAHCFPCHNDNSAAASLNLTSFQKMMAGRDDDSNLIIPGNSRRSELMRRILGEGGLPQMPMGFAPLNEEKLNTIRSWIDQGAKAGSGRAAIHWAYVQPVRPALPSAAANPIDAFVVDRLKKEGLSLSPATSKEKLIRRATLDVTGLPPTPEEIDAFLADTSPNAYEKVVDRLLASPQYGERQALKWLDLARYADTHGYEKDLTRAMWPFRDWVIKAFNENMPFDEFTIEQIAGDMLPTPTQDQLIATGFHRNTMYNDEGGVDKEEQHWLTVVDRVAATGQVWLGSTLGCAQCHDHKYDPFSHEEYFKFFAYFDNAEEPNLELYDPADKSKKERLEVDAHGLYKVFNNASLPEEERKKARAEWDKIQAEIRTLTHTTMIFKEKPGEPKTLYRKGGAYLEAGHEVKAGVPEVLPGLPEGAPNNRLGLAEWLVSRDNPLTARVTVNRIWEQYFGIGIVKTSEDFGTQSSPPSHPELLDWLAVEFMEKGWDLKHIHRLILTSDTYKQSSRISAELLKKDPENLLLARGPRFRLDAELIRDNALEIGGLLSDKIGGPSVYPPQPVGIWDSPYSGERWIESSGDNRYRRGLYTFWKRTATYPSFLTFDATSRELCTLRRIRTNTPLQALVIMNDPVYIEAAQGLARRMMAIEATDAERLRYGFRLCTARVPSDKELASLSAYLTRQKAEYAQKPDEAKKLAPSADQAAWVMAASVMLNLDETITKD